MSDQSLQPTGTQSLSTLSEADQAMLDADRKKMGGPSLPSIPQIRLANTDMVQTSEGEYFTELYKGKDEEPEIRELGPNPEITILYKTNTYSYYTKEDGLIAWTSDIHGFSSLDTVTLYLKKDGKVTIDFEGPYPEFKAYKERYVTEDPITGKPRKLLKFKTVLYVLFEGKPYKLFVSNASNAGVDADGNPAFEDPQPLSLQVFNDFCWRNKRAAYEFTVRLGSNLVRQKRKTPDGSVDHEDNDPSVIYAKVPKPYYIMTFEMVGETPESELPMLLRARRDAEQAIYMIDDARKQLNAPVEPSTTVDDLPEFDSN